VVRRVLMTRSSSRADSRAKSGRCSTCACTVACSVPGGDRPMRRTSVPLPRLAYRNDAGSSVCLSWRGLGGEPGLQEARPNAVACTESRQLQRLIFISMDPGEPLDEYLGRLQVLSDFYTRQSKAGLRSGSQRGGSRPLENRAENFAGDMYHTPNTYVGCEIGLFREPKAKNARTAQPYWADRGGGTTTNWRRRLPGADALRRLHR